MIVRTLLLLAFSLAITSCGDDTENGEYREEYAGTYNGTKSNRSFEDDMFTTDIEIVVTVHPDVDSLLIVNDLNVPISETGTYQGNFEGNFFDLKFEDGSLKMVTFPDFIGITISCYIQGEKI